MLIHDLLVANAKKLNDKIALTEINYSKQDMMKTNKQNRKTITWKELNCYSNQISNYFVSMGVNKGSKVAILMRNSIDYLAIYFGILKIGAIAVPINYNNTVSEICNCLNISNSIVIAFSSEFSETIKACKNNLTSVEHFINFGTGELYFAECADRILNGFSEEFAKIDIDPDDTSAIYFSSGTTGNSKAIMLSPQAMIIAAKTEQRHHLQTEDDIFLIIPPLYHTGAQIHWFGNLISGGGAVILNQTSPQMILETIARENITIGWLLLIWVQDIFGAIDAGDIDINKYDLSSLRLMHMGAQPIPMSVVRKWKEIFPDKQFDINYGLTESGGPGCINLGFETNYKPQMLGLPDEEWKVGIRKGEQIVEDKNFVGEICVKGPSVMKGYYNDINATNMILSRTGWLYTGDIGYIDENGYVFYTGRKKDIIIVNGENIYPIEIENHIRAVQGVREVAVVGIPNDRFGEVITAVVEIGDCSNEYSIRKNIKRQCRSLPLYKQPMNLYFDTIPRNSTGKVDKKQLRSKYTDKEKSE